MKFVSISLSNYEKAGNSVQGFSLRLKYPLGFLSASLGFTDQVL